jgi:tripartite-type tricarboxylate transporter receptor subunit TctC
MHRRHLPATGRRTLLAGGAGALLLQAGQALAQTYPARPVRLIIPFTPGGPTDIIARAMADRLQSRWGQPVVIENRAGASGTIGTDVAARAAPDGYTLLLAASSHVMNPSLFPRLPFDPINSFTPITRVASYSLVLVVNPANNIRSVSDLVENLKARPGSIAVGSTGIGSVPHLAAVQFARMAGVEFTHVPYPGSAQTATALLSNEVQAMFQGSLVMPLVRAGQLRGLAVTGAERMPDAPELPTLEELGYHGYRAGVWYGVMAPAGLPAELVSKLHRDIRWAMDSPEVREKLAVQGFGIDDVGPAEFAANMRSELTKWADLIRNAGIKPD